jgi:hypothetical protein
MCYFNLARVSLSVTKIATGLDNNKKRLKFNANDRTPDKFAVCITVGTVSESLLLSTVNQPIRKISIHPFAQEHRREWTYLGIKFDFDWIQGQGSNDLGQSYTTLPFGVASCK